MTHQGDVVELENLPEETENVYPSLQNNQQGEDIDHASTSNDELYTRPRTDTEQSATQNADESTPSSGAPDLHTAVLPLYAIQSVWSNYRCNRVVPAKPGNCITQFKLAIIVCIVGVVALVVCLTVGLMSGPVVCKSLLTIGTIAGGAIASLGGIWMTAAQPSHISKTKIAVVIAGLIGIGGIITTTLDQIKDWCPSQEESNVAKPEAAKFDYNFLLIGGQSLKYYTHDFVTIYNPTTKKASIRDKNLPIGISAMVADKNKESGVIMLAGGVSPVGYLSNSFLYNASTQIVTPLSHMSIARSMAAGGWIGDTFIICGGNVLTESDDPEDLLSANDFTDSCEGYNIKLGEWTALKSMPYPICDTAHVTNHTYLYIFGGSVGWSNVSNRAIVYSLTSNSWSHLPRLPWGKRNSPSAVVFKDSIIICGGLVVSPFRDCTKYNPATRQYTAIAAMLNPRFAFVLMQSNDKLFAIGGKKGNNEDVEQVEMFDGKSWIQFAQMDFGISYFQAVSFVATKI